MADAAGELAYMGDSTPAAYANAVFRPADLTEAQLGVFWAYLHHAMRQMLKEIKSLDGDSAADGSLTTSPAERRDGDVVFSLD